MRDPLFVRAARFGWNFARSADFRNVMLLRWRRPPNLFQPFSDTTENRYPLLFEFVRREIGDGDDRHILSFGCSTGAEVFALRRYFPRALIKGVDINPRNIRIAWSRLAAHPDARLAFTVAGSTTAEETARYDAIFCMVVLRNGALGIPRPGDRCDHLVRFAEFERTVADFARCLRPGGILFIAASNFRFSDTDVASDFDVIYREDAQAKPLLPIFDRNNCFLPGVGYGDIGFRKRSTPA